MAVELASAYVQIIPSLRGAQGTIAKELGGAGATAGRTFSTGFVGTAANGFGKVAATTGKILGGGIAAVAASVGGIALGKGLSRALDIQDAQKKLAGLGHSAGSVTKIMDNALSSVKGTAFGLGDAATVAASAVAAGIKPGQELTKYLKLTADASTIAGTSLGDMGQILNAVNANGTVYSDTLNQLSNRGVPVFQYLQKEYGVTADGLSTMVKKGQVDAKTLDKVLAQHLGGAALKSGETARGAFANVGAALGRLGVQFGAGAAVAAAPALFTAIAGAVDSAGAALKPYSDQISAFITATMTKATTFINGIDFGAVIKKVQEVVSRVRVTLGNMFSGVKTGDFSSFGATFADIRAVITPLFPLFVTVGKAVGQLAGSFGAVIAAGIPLLPPILNLLAGALGFVADHMGVIGPLLPVIAAGFILWRSATTGVAAANRLLTAAQLAMLPVTLLNTSARLAAANAEIRLAAAQGLAVPGMIASAAAMARQAAATALSTAAAVAGRVAMVAGAVATGIATAAQWAFNAALTANPIGIIVVAIAAVVAALIFFFTQTKVGQDVWTGFVSFLTSAWNTIVTVAQTVFSAVVGFVQKYGLLILAAVAPVIGIPILIATHWNQITGTVSRVWNAVVGFVTGGVARVVGAVATLNSRIVATFANIGSTLFNAGRSIIQNFINGISSMVGAVGNAVSGIMNFVKGFFPHSPAKRGPFSGSGWTQVAKSGATLAGQFTDGFNSGVKDFASNVGGIVPDTLTSSVAGTVTHTAQPAGSQPIYTDHGVLFGMIQKGADGVARLVLDQQNAAEGAAQRLGYQQPVFG